MIEIAVDDKIIQIPEKLTVRQYQQFIKNQHLYEKDPVALLSMYLDIPVDELKSYPYEQMDFIKTYITSVMTQEVKKELVMVFEYEGVEYGLENDWSKLSWGAWVDLEVFSSENVTDNIHNLLAVLYRPVLTKNGTEYTIEPYKSSEIERRGRLFMNVDADIWFGCASFFFYLVNLSIIDTRNSLARMNKWNKRIVKGYRVLPQWVKKRLPLDTILLSPTSWQKKTSSTLSK